MTTTPTTAGGLGRREHFDVRNLAYQITDVVPIVAADATAALAASRVQRLLETPGPIPAVPTSERHSVYFWDSAWWGDQGDTPHCTAFALSHAMADGPVTHRRQNPMMDPHALYTAIQTRDRASGRFYDEGATSLAMAQEAQARGWIGEYRWGYDLAAFVTAIRVGPVLLGIDWYSGMDDPDEKEAIIHATGRIRGGHEIVCNGADFASGMARVKQSWGRAWGRRGHAYLPFADLERLIADGGDVLLFRELPAQRPAE
jgi:hypothetical protein